MSRCPQGTVTCMVLVLCLDLPSAGDSAMLRCSQRRDHAALGDRGARVSPVQGTVPGKVTGVPVLCQDVPGAGDCAMLKGSPGCAG